MDCLSILYKFLAQLEFLPTPAALIKDLMVQGDLCCLESIYGGKKWPDLVKFDKVSCKYNPLNITPNAHPCIVS